MNKIKRKSSVALALALVLGLGMRLYSQTAPPPPQQIASVEQLKTEAFAALKNGQFEQTSQLINRAALLPLLSQIAALSEQIERYDVHVEQLAQRKYPFAGKRAAA